MPKVKWTLKKRNYDIVTKFLTGVWEEATIFVQFVDNNEAHPGFQ